MSAKLATLGFLKIMLFWNKGYHVIISVHDVANKTLLRDSNYIVGVIMWPKFGNSSIFMKEVLNLNFVRILPEMAIICGGLLVQVQ